MTRRQTRTAAPEQPTVVLCRGCCCGTGKIPGVDHRRQLDELRSASTDTARFRVVDCLDACEHANVVVVQPTPDARANGARPVWLGLVNDPDATADITEWIAAGGPGQAALPGMLDLYVFSPSRRVRAALDTE